MSIVDRISQFRKNKEERNHVTKNSIGANSFIFGISSKGETAREMYARSLQNSPQPGDLNLKEMVTGVDVRNNS
jgi:hypothetical protein